MATQNEDNPHLHAHHHRRHREHRHRHLLPHREELEAELVVVCRFRLSYQASHVHNSADEQILQGRNLFDTNRSKKNASDKRTRMCNIVRNVMLTRGSLVRSLRQLIENHSRVLPPNANAPLFDTLDTQQKIKTASHEPCAAVHSDRMRRYNPTPLQQKIADYAFIALQESLDSVFVSWT